MRIGFDAKRAFLNRSGLGNYSRDIIRSLHQNYTANEYFLYTPNLKNSLPVVEGESITISKPPESYGKLRQAYWRSLMLSNQVQKDKLDIYHGLSNELPRNIHKSGAKTVVTIHDLIFMRYPEWYKPLDRAIYKKKFSSSSKTADRVITVSQQTKADLIDFFGIEEKKIKVIYQGCNEVFKNTLNEKHKSEVKTKWELPDEYLLYVGTIEKRKNLLNLIKAIHQQGITIPLVVVGRQTAYMKQVNEYIMDNDLKNILFLKEVSVEDLPGIYQMAKIFIYPSVFEGFGIPILEAMVSGVPVITSKGGCFSEVGGDSSIYIDPSNVEELGTELKKLISDTAQQQKMIAAGLKHATQFSNTTIASQIMELYKEMLNE